MVEQQQPKESRESKNSIQVIERMMTLLDVLAHHHDAVSLKLLSQETGLHPSTAHRILGAMTSSGFVERAEPGAYRLGIRLLELGNIVKSRINIRQVALPYDRPARAAGRSKYGLVKLTRLALDGLISFSSLPLRLVTLLGGLNLAVSLGLMVWVLADAWVGRTAPRGWASLASLVLFSASVQMIALGILGEYLRQIFLETKRRPVAVVASVAGRHTRTDDYCTTPPCTFPGMKDPTA